MMRSHSSGLYFSPTFRLCPADKLFACVSEAISNSESCSERLVKRPSICRANLLETYEKPRKQEPLSALFCSAASLAQPSRKRCTSVACCQPEFSKSKRGYTWSLTMMLQSHLVYALGDCEVDVCSVSTLSPSLPVDTHHRSEVSHQHSPSWRHLSSSLESMSKTCRGKIGCRGQ